MHIIKVTLLIFLTPLMLHSLDYSNKQEVKAFIKKMHKKYNYNEAYLKKLFSHVRKNTRVPSKSTTKKALKTKSISYPKGEWDIYARLHLENNQTQLGANFMHKYHKELQRAYQEYGVPAEYITAIIGIESYYGKNRGRYYVFDQLTHLAFDGGKRQKFYRHELQEFLRLCYREQLEPRAIKGSASGAIGMAQFMPSNYKSLAVDFDKDGKIRLSTPLDAIGSIANYFKKNGWRKDEPVSTRVSYEGDRFYGLKTGYSYRYHRRDLKNIRPREYFPYNKKVMLIKLKKEKYDELWYGAHNFYVITRYNHSSYYAMAVHQLAQRIKKSYLAQYNKKEKATKQRLCMAPTYLENINGTWKINRL